jgi:hypothetical protein
MLFPNIRPIIWCPISEKRHLLKFPRNYPYTNEDETMVPISVSPMVIVEAEPYDEMSDITYNDATDCFFSFLFLSPVIRPLG